MRIFGYAQDTRAQQNLNKFGFVFDLCVSLYKNMYYERMDYHKGI